MAVSIPVLPEGGFPPDRLAAMLARRLPQNPSQQTGHDEDHPVSVMPLSPGGIAAAVLIPVIAQPQPVLLFTRRTASLAHHAGQVAFPGGRMERDDADPLYTALRETAEETGIAPAHVRLAGYLSRYRTGTGFDIQPVVGVLPPGLTLNPDPAEVASIFEVPLAFFRDPANRRQETREWAGRQRSYFAFTWQDHEIWGATAALIVDLVTRLGDVEMRNAY